MIQPLKLNIGAGTTQLAGYIPIDKSLGGDARKLDYPNDSVDVIRASHVIEHLSFCDAKAALKEWARVLRPGGELLIATPDLDKIARSNHPMRRFWLMGGQTNEDNFHRSCFDQETLDGYLRETGFTSIEEWTPDNGDTASHGISLCRRAIKAQQQARLEIKICAITSIPRIGWNDHWGCIVDALRPFGIPLRRFTGAFWGQGMQGMLEDALADGLDWVITLDYDTMFTMHHLDRLMGIMGTRAEIDAIASMQLGRQRTTPLCSIRRDDGETKTELAIDGAPFQVSTANFGLTILRLECLARVAKPWFLGTPDGTGGWRSTEKVDDDIHFWRQWTAAGNTVYVAPDVRVGHLELMVGEFDENLQPRHISVVDWYKRETGRDTRWK
jgi:predicted SAM-dependent methyltransferase